MSEQTSEQMRAKAKEFREKDSYKKMENSTYYDLGEALDEVKNADGIGVATSSAKLIGKSMFNLAKTLMLSMPDTLENMADKKDKS